MSAFSAVADCLADDGWVKAEFEVSYRQIGRGANCLNLCTILALSTEHLILARRTRFWICRPMEMHDTQSVLVKRAILAQITMILRKVWLA